MAIRNFTQGGDQVDRAADNDTSSATAAAAATAAEAVDGNGGADSGGAESF